MAAQTLTIRDASTRQPIEYAEVYHPGLRIAQQTDAAGRVSIQAFGATDSLFVRRIGYRDAVATKAALERAGFVLFLQEDALSLDAVVVSALRWEQSRRETPQLVRVVKQRDVLLQNPQTAADLLGISGEIYIQKSQLGGGSPMVRGFATNRVLLTVDGIRMNTAIFRSGNLQNVISLDPYATASTELLFGPGSVMYGSDAIAGVLHFHTLTPSLADSGKIHTAGQAALRYSSANEEKTGHADIQFGGKKWAFLSSATWSDFGDLRMGKNGPDDYLRPTYVERQDGKDVVVTNPDPLVQHPTAYSQLNLMQKVRFQASKHWEFNYGVHYSTTSDYSRYDRLLRPKGSTLRSAEWQYGPQVWMMHALQATHTATRGLYDALQVRLGYQHFEESRMDRDLNKPTRYVRQEKVDALSGNIDFGKKIDARQRLYYGLEGVLDKVYSSGTDENVVSGSSQPGPSRYPNGSSWTSLGLYATHVYKLTEKWLVQSGLRYNQFGIAATFAHTFYPFPFDEVQIQQGSVSGSIGWVYNPDHRTQVSMNLSRGFRMPNIDDLGKVFDSTPGAVVVPNPDLRPEYARNLDVSIAHTVGSVLRFDATAFYTHLDQALVRRPFQFNGQDSLLYNGTLSRVEAIQNAAKAWVWGLQAGAEISLPKGFGISGRVNYQHGEEELDNGTTAPLRHAAPVFGAGHFTWRGKALQADLYVLFNGMVSPAGLAPEELGKDYLYARNAEGQLYVPAWHTWNIKLLYPISNAFSLSAGLENIGNVRYRPYSSGITAPGRNLVMSMRARF